MTKTNRFSVSAGPSRYPLSSRERHEAYLAEIANKQQQLKAEAAERAQRAAREQNGETQSAEPEPGAPAGNRRRNTH